MFVSRDEGTARKPFQKPNILRRKSKVLRLSAQKNSESEFSDTVSLSPTSSDIQPTPPLTLIEQPVEECNQLFHIDQASTFNVVDITDLCDKNQIDTSQTLEIDGDSVTIYAHDIRVDNNTCSTESMLNVESFLNDGAIKQNNIVFNTDGTLSSRITETDIKQKWCLDYMSEEPKDTVTTNNYNGSQLRNIYYTDTDKSLDLSVNGEVHNQSSSHEFTNVPAQNIESSNQTRAVKLKCNMPNCNKEFWTEARLQKHKNVHNKQKIKTPTVLDCPVKKTDADGVEIKCGRTFLVRNQLMKHLNEDHAAEDALFRCTVCGRRFFWAGGARAHQAGACARLFACAWAGCGRVFRHPCRLREHARAHTGDRPYPCHYPNCGWSFRSASKLVRHARRHTGERRHACAACGRAFPRREHLRDHTARHHATGERHKCTEPGCEETFPSVSSLCMHTRKVHKENGGKTPATKKAPRRAKKDVFVVSLLDPQPVKVEAQAEATVATAAEETGPASASTSVSTSASDFAMDSVIEGAEARCARTHCTWPLQRGQHADFALEEDAQVEQSESSESNIYTVRSDLFLHGNVLINEDSEFIISRAATGAEGAGAAEGEEGGALGLIDSHPTIDLMQEELMYADAVDESSFRVFLLNNEELA